MGYFLPHPVSLVLAPDDFVIVAADAGAAMLTVVRPTARRMAATGFKICEFMEQILLISGQTKWCPRPGAH